MKRKAVSDRAATRDGAAKQFWSDVEHILREQYHRSPRKAQEAIEQYKQEVVARIHEVAYNQGEEQTAKVIDGIIEDGIPAPTVTD